MSVATDHFESLSLVDFCSSCAIMRRDFQRSTRREQVLTDALFGRPVPNVVLIQTHWRRRMAKERWRAVRGMLRELTLRTSWSRLASLLRLHRIRSEMATRVANSYRRYIQRWPTRSVAIQRMNILSRLSITQRIELGRRRAEGGAKAMSSSTRTSAVRVR